MVWVSWEPIKRRMCDRLGEEVSLEAKLVFPSDIFRQPARVAPTAVRVGAATPWTNPAAAGQDAPVTIRLIDRTICGPGSVFPGAPACRPWAVNPGYLPS
jgi:hypothetical protein